MPPKRRKAAEPEDAPDSKRRITRSASKVTAPAKVATAQRPQDEVAKPSRPKKPVTKPASPKPKKSPKKPSDSKKTSANSNDSKDDDSPSVPTAPTTLTIEHGSLAKPITCHQYTTPSKPKRTTPTLIFTHGAGGTLSAPAVVHFCTGFSTRGPILAFHGSMNLSARVKGFHACISHLSSPNSDPLLLGGRSMGARAAVIAATEVLASNPSREVSLVLASYPLKGPRNDIRDQILLDLPASVRVLFVIGEKDAMCPLDLLEETRQKMAAGSKLVVVRGADHGMHVKPVAEEKRVGEEAGRMVVEWAGGEGGDVDVYIGGDEEG